MFQKMSTALRATLLISVCTGVIFPCLVTALAQLFFPEQANGSLLRNSSGQIIGSRLIGQAFTKPDYFHSRPSAAGAGYCGEASGGTNLGPTSSKLFLGQVDDPGTKEINESFEGVKQIAQKYRGDNRLGQNEKVPVDAVTRSASGLDPHISLSNALLQARRIARTRELDLKTVKLLIDKNTEPRDLGFLGEVRVNVLTLNIALDQLQRR